MVLFRPQALGSGWLFRCSGQPPYLKRAACTTAGFAPPAGRGCARAHPLTQPSGGHKRITLCEELEERYPMLKGAKQTSVALGETLRLALDALRSHKLRSFLTLLGVILAVTTLVAVMSVVSGMNFYVADRIANLGANVFIVDRFGIITSQDQWVKAQKRPLLTMDEYEW